LAFQGFVRLDGIRWLEILGRSSPNRDDDALLAGLFG
jgi:hypothetical protein